MPRNRLRAALLIGCALLPSSCVQSAVTEGRITGLERASVALYTLHDYDIARAVFASRVGELEQLHYLSPDDADLLLLLVRTWVELAYGFIQDDHEAALEQGDEGHARYHLLRVEAAYQRAFFYGTELLARSASGFDQVKRERASLRQWLERHFTDPAHAGPLLWTGIAWLGSARSSDPESDLGVELVRRSIELDEKLAFGTGHAVLGAYYAERDPPEPANSRRHFDRAEALSSGKYLLTRLALAVTLHCRQKERDDYERVLTSLLDAGDPLPQARLQNVIAKRRARRSLNSAIQLKRCGF